MKVVEAEDRLGDCVAIREAVFVKEQGVPMELEVDEMDSPGSSCTHFLMLDGEKCVGTFRGYFETEDTVHLQRFCILKEYRGRGYGKEAFEFAEKYFSARGAGKITFGAQCSAIGFYESCGCRAVSDVFLDAGLPHRTMEKKLACMAPDLKK
ncbi:MAG: GNAT family N-acetyltransferase [Clostridia bacterium]|nr:GNAT family N-acetyltransferase [Clostridia bacterium]